MTDPRDRPLGEQDLDPDPLVVFRRWFDAAVAAGAFEPEAVVLATATPDGRPSARMVLAKDVDERGFAFYTNYGSRKGGELEANRPRRAPLPLARARPAGSRGGARRAAAAEDSESYARNRSHDSQLSALASPQSRAVPSREWLEEQVAALAREHEGRELPFRDDWGGYRLIPDAWEFWQHRPSRLHDRFRYLPEAGGGWRIERLGP